MELLRDVEALQIEPLQVRPIDENGEWPCPFCRRAKPTKTAFSARVRNRTGPEHERWVRVCADCVIRVRRTTVDRSDSERVIHSG